MPMRAASFACLGVLLVIAFAKPGAGTESPPEPAAPTGASFLPSEDALADAMAAIDRASAAGKRALVVLGANWCHDSRALAARLQESPLGELITARYETVLVDVGYLDQGRDVARAMGTPIYYATPTVLIVDPVSGRLVNDHDRHQWGAAANIGMDESVAYFERMASAETAVPGPALEENPQVSADIDAYERRLAEKVARGYDRVGPMLRAYKEGGQVPDSFDSEWSEVAEFRTSVPEMVRAARRAARSAMATGATDPVTDASGIKPYSWE